MVLFIFSGTASYLTNPAFQLGVAAVAGVLLVAAWFLIFGTKATSLSKSTATLAQFFNFAYSCFFKPHTGDGTGNQQDALDSFYKSQAGIYDATRTRLLQGREDMIALVAAQVKHRRETCQIANKPVWVDIGGGTGWNIEQMGCEVDVPTFFHAVYLVDLSTSLCEVARKRFKRLGWKNVHVICKDARTFHLAHYETDPKDEKRDCIGSASYMKEDLSDSVGADLLTMSYSLSMIPEFHPVIDSVANFLAPNGVVGVVDFYVQNKIEFSGRNYTGGSIDRHCMWISRVFWRTWFELDRVNLEGTRRDYIEYKFGTILSTNRRCHLFGFRIPYYIFVGCTRTTLNPMRELATVNAVVTESPFIQALDAHAQNLPPREAGQSVSVERRSKAYDTAIANLAASLPLPAAYYQNNKTRIYYDDTLQKHRQFNDEYIYAFTWEDSRADLRLLKITSEDVILALTSAGDNILSYATERPKRIHAVDLNPSQNHLLELKVAAFRSLEYAEFWKLFGEGKHEDFHGLLVRKLSPHLSSHAFDYWFHIGPATFSPQSQGLYGTGGSRHALRLTRWLGRALGVGKDIKRMCEAQTLVEQREIWDKRIRRVFLSQLLAYFVIGSKSFLWKALGVPGEQRAMIEGDYKKLVERGSTSEEDHPATTRKKSSVNKPDDVRHLKSGQAIWNYGVQTLDPVAAETLLSEDNHYYLLCLQGHYTQRCHPTYLTPKSHGKLSTPGALDNLRIHTDELSEVFEHMQSEALTIAVLMDSMDWLTPGGPAAPAQVKAVNRAMKMGGRVLIRSAGLDPWYMRVFEENGFLPKRVAARVPLGTCIDRVNMYASTWICTKTLNITVAE